MKVERVSYDIMTPSAARGILEAIHWKPAIVWVVDRIHVLKPIRFQSFRRNEVATKIPAESARRAMVRDSIAGLGVVVDDVRQQRAMTMLVDVDYVIEAHFDLTARAQADDTAAKHVSMFNRRAASGQCFHRPCLGVREFAAEFDLVAEGTPLPPSALDDDGVRDLGWMAYEPGYTVGAPARFFRARMEAGVLDVAACLADGLAA
nr:type I-C CRISPR-associated protein Cas5c [Polymorphobacter sp.]